MRAEYSKLVRDRIPEIIRADSRRCETSVLSDEEFKAALLQKLIEEATEASMASAEGLLTELADVQEIVDALLAANRISTDDLRSEQLRRRVERGGFDGRIKLEWTE